MHPDRTMANAFEGMLIKCGAKVPLASLWPDARYPKVPILLEFAGSDYSGRGHNRSRQIHVLWRLDVDQLVWVEVARTLSYRAEWILQLRPIALQELGGVPAPDPDLALQFAARFLRRLDDELKDLGAGDRALAVNFLFEQIAARLAGAAVEL